MARLYDYLLGGHHNFAVDRQFGQQVLRAEPNARSLVAENRAFLGRAARFLVGSGIRQFLDLGSGIPAAQNVHEIAQRDSHDARVVYVDKDPIAVAQGRQILALNPLAISVNEDLREPLAVLTSPQVRKLIDFSQPVGLLLVNVLHLIPDSSDPAGLVGRFARWLAPGSYLVISHPTYESVPRTAALVEGLYQAASVPIRTRSAADVQRLFAGFEMVEPGLVYAPSWRPDGEAPEHPERIWLYAGVGRKPTGPG